VNRVAEVQENPDMMRHPFRSAFAVSLALAAGVAVFAIAAGSGGTLIMTIYTPATAVCAGGTISGIATDPAAEVVEVKMYIDGVLVAEDLQMDGDSNEFDFAIPPDAAGKELKIVATSNLGNEVVRKFTVRNGR
jgi:hypothetical protein